MFDNLKRHFFVGVFTIAPFALTLYIVILLGGWFDSLFQPAIRIVLKQYFEVPPPLPGLGIAVGFIFIVILGMFSPSFFGKQFVKVGETIVQRIPLAKMIYAAARQIFDAFSSTGTEKFSSVVMVPFPKEGSWSMGFVTKEAKNGWVPGQQQTRLAVFVPTTPNPTSGWLMFVNVKEAIPLDISVEEGLKMVISGGLASPPYLSELQEKAFGEPLA